MADRRCKRTGHPVSDFYSGTIPLDTHLGQSKPVPDARKLSALTVAQRLQVICMSQGKAADRHKAAVRERH